LSNESLKGEIGRLRGAIEITQQKIWKNWGVEPRSLEILRWLDGVLAVNLDDQKEERKDE
jgi:hypothetical protein